MHRVAATRDWSRRYLHRSLVEQLQLTKRMINVDRHNSLGYLVEGLSSFEIFHNTGS